MQAWLSKRAAARLDSLGDEEGYLFVALLLDGFLCLLADLQQWAARGE